VRLYTGLLKTTKKGRKEIARRLKAVQKENTMEAQKGGEDGETRRRY
jgi:hypothetical protein